MSSEQQEFGKRKIVINKRLGRIKDAQQWILNLLRNAVFHKYDIFDSIYVRDNVRFCDVMEGGRNWCLKHAFVCNFDVEECQ